MAYDYNSNYIKINIIYHKQQHSVLILEVVLGVQVQADIFL